MRRQNSRNWLLKFKIIFIKEMAPAPIPNRIQRVSAIFEASKISIKTALKKSPITPPTRPKRKARVILSSIEGRIVLESKPVQKISTGMNHPQKSGFTQNPQKVIIDCQRDGCKTAAKQRIS